MEEKNDNRDRQLRHLSQSIRLKESASPRLVKMTMTSVSITVLAFLAWSAVADVHEIAHTPGEIVPSGFQQVVQHLEGGMVKEILVHEGDAVDQGQLLLRLDGAGAEEDLKRAEEQKYAYDMQKERLRAFIEKRAPSFGQAATPAAAREQEFIFSSMEDAKKQEADIITGQIAQKKQAIVALTSDLQTAQQNFAILQDLYTRRQKLFEKGYIPEMKLLETKQSYNQMRGQVESLRSQIAGAQSAIGEYESRLSALTAGNIDDANQKLDALNAAAAANEQTIEKLRDRVTRLDVRAPVKGIVKGLTVNTIGGVVQPGQELVEIVPTDAPLIVNLKIPPRYIGHIKVGQKVQVKFSSFDFARYGSVAGSLQFISAAAFSGEGGERYYQGRVALDKTYVGSDSRNVFMPGMTVMADIITGDKTILQYLLKPIRNALSTAFTER